MSVEQQWGVAAPDYQSLHNFSLTHPEASGSRSGRFRRARDDGRARRGRSRPHAGRAVLSGRPPQFRREPAAPADDDVRPSCSASENGTDRTLLGSRSCTLAVGALRAALRANGVVAGDRVAAFIPNIPEADRRRARQPRRSARSGRPARPTSACRASSTGSGRSSPWCSSPPTAISTPDKTHDSLARVSEVARRDPERSDDDRRPVRRRGASLDGLRGGVLWSEFVGAGPAEPRFEQLPFNHPLYILYSSGTTGVPEVHRARRGRHAAPASQGTSAPLRHQAPAIASSTSRPAAG